MNRRNRGKIIISIGISFLIFLGFCNYSLFALLDDTERILDTDKYKTAIAISRKGWDNSDYAILVRGDDYADGLSACPLAYKYSAPILMTDPYELDKETIQELDRLGVKHLIIIGGFGAVSQSIEDTIKKERAITIERIYGDNRYQTSTKIAQKFSASEVALVAGDNYSDALSVAVIAAIRGMPILLTPKESLPIEISNYLLEREVSKTYIIGGLEVINPEVDIRLPGSLRLAGGNRFETNAIILNIFASELDFTNIYVARVNEGFTDALAGGVLAARTSSPLVFIDSDHGDCSLAAINNLQPKFSKNTKIIGIGNEDTVPSSILETIVSYIADSGDNQNDITYHSDSDSSPTPVISSPPSVISTTPTAIGISLQNIIPANGEFTLSVEGGPLSDSSWQDIFEQITCNTGDGENWITEIIRADLAMTVADDGVTAIIKNTSSQQAIITQDFIIPASKVVDRDGKTTSENMFINSYVVVVTEVESSTDNGYYKEEETINISIHFSGDVDVAGTPLLHLETGGSNQEAIYTVGSGTSVISFSYTAQAGDISEALDYLGVDALDLNGGSIKATDENEDALLTLAIPGEIGSLSATKSIVIDTVAPSSINISSQNTIPSKDSVVLSVEGGPLLDSSWLGILGQLKSNIVIGTWIKGIEKNQLLITINDDGASAILHNNNPSNDALIVSDFIIPANKVVDRAGNVALNDVLIDAYTDD